MCLTLAIKVLARAHSCCYNVDGHETQDPRRLSQLLDKTQRRPSGLLLLSIVVTCCCFLSFVCLFLVSTVAAHFLTSLQTQLSGIACIIPALIGMFIFIMGLIEYKATQQSDDSEISEELSSLSVHLGHDAQGLQQF